MEKFIDNKIHVSMKDDIWNYDPGGREMKSHTKAAFDCCSSAERYCMNEFHLFFRKRRLKDGF
jgi:hypothetical protein